MDNTASVVRPAWRIWILALFSTALFIGLGFRLGYLQIIQKSYYDAVAENQRRRAAELRPHRGTIYMSDSKSDSTDDSFPVATNKRGWTIYAVPRDMSDPQQVADQLAPALLAFRQRQDKRARQIIATTGQQRQLEQTTPTPTPSPEPNSHASTDQLDLLRADLYSHFNRRTDPYEPLIRPYELIDDEFKSFVDNQQLEGIVLEEEEVRIYPEQTLASHVLGYVGYEDTGRTGRYGVEGHFNDALSGKLGFFSAESDNAGKYIGVGHRQLDPAQDGIDITLTIDRVVQSFVEEELKKGVEKYGAERGSIIIMDPRDDSVLAMATYPTYDPNFYYSISDPRVQLNPVISDIFEPGSILKPLIMASAINEGIVEPDTTMVDNGPVHVAEYTINTFDSQHHGVITMTQILEQSNNVGMVWVGQQLGAENMYDYLRRFGLGEKTGIQLEGETQTNLPEPDKWNITTVATTSFGQGVALTPLQALNGINAIANGGTLMAPHIIKSTRDANGEINKTQPTFVRSVVSSSTSDKVTAMMVSVIENGVAKLARVPGYYLAGKTGTAQVPDERGRYSPDRKIISFVGFGPVEDPQFSILIKLDNPSGLSFASGTAAPMFRALAERLLQYYQIPPSYDSSTKPQYSVGSPNG